MVRVRVCKSWYLIESTRVAAGQRTELHILPFAVPHEAPGHVVCTTLPHLDSAKQSYIVRSHDWVTVDDRLLHSVTVVP